MKVRTSPNGSSAGGLLAQSAWAQADKMVAKALLDAESLCARMKEECARRRGASKAAFEALEAEALLVRQSIAEAAALRGIFIFGVPGEKCAYDPMRHKIAAASTARRRAAPKWVTIVSSGILRRGEEPEQIMSHAMTRAALGENASPTRKSNKRP